MNLLLSIMGITSLLPERSYSQKGRAFSSGCFSPLLKITHDQKYCQKKTLPFSRVENSNRAENELAITEHFHGVEPPQGIGIAHVADLEEPSKHGCPHSAEYF